MSLFKREGATASRVEPKSSIQQIEKPKNLSASKEKDVQPSADKVLDGQIVDEETAKYLDSSIVIDDETNTRIKRMVSGQYLSEGSESLMRDRIVG